jgi:hypothetical protein
MVPEPGQLVHVRQRAFVVESVLASTGLPDVLRPDGLARSQHLVTLSSIEDDALGDRLRVIWEVEPGASIRERGHLPVPTNGFDDPATLDAFLDAVRWGAISSADMHALQSPFRSGIRIGRQWLEHFTVLGLPATGRNPKGRAPSARARPSAEGGYGDYGVGVVLAAAAGVATATGVVVALALASVPASASASGVSTATGVVLAAASGVAAACGASCRRCPPRVSCRRCPPRASCRRCPPLWRPWTEAWCTLSCFPVPPGRPWAEAAAGRTRAAASTATANERRERVMVMWVILFPFRLVLPAGPVPCGPLHIQ